MFYNVYNDRDNDNDYEDDKDNDDITHNANKDLIMYITYVLQTYRWIN